MPTLALGMRCGLEGSLKVTKYRKKKNSAWELVEVEIHIFNDQAIQLDHSTKAPR